MFQLTFDFFLRVKQFVRCNRLIPTFLQQVQINRSLESEPVAIKHRPRWPFTLSILLQAAAPKSSWGSSLLPAEYSQVGFGSTVDWNSPQLSPHAQVLSNHSHQGNAGCIDQPPGEHSWRMRVVHPAEDHVEEVHSDGKVQALLPTADEEPQTQSADRKTQVYSTVSTVCTTVNTNYPQGNIISKIEIHSFVCIKIIYLHVSNANQDIKTSINSISN